MAVKIIASRNEGMKDGKNYMRAELIADSASYLTIEGVNNYHFLFGSIAYAIAEKSFYVLNSSGTWVSSSEDSENVTPSRALNSTLNRPVSLTSTKPVTLSPDVTESDTSDSEGVTDDVKESEGTGEIMEEIPETKTLESKEVTEDVKPLRNTESE
ncbi:MAG: hypothetical protein J6V06_07450 [Clostridia bacterium]|nr:hypothetical protein [Clostridia bacterium]